MSQSFMKWRVHSFSTFAKLFKKLTFLTHCIRAKWVIPQRKYRSLQDIRIWNQKSQIFWSGLVVRGRYQNSLLILNEFKSVNFYSHWNFVGILNLHWTDYLTSCGHVIQAAVWCIIRSFVTFMKPEKFKSRILSVGMFTQNRKCMEYLSTGAVSELRSKIFICCDFCSASVGISVTLLVAFYKKSYECCKKIK